MSVGFVVRLRPKPKDGEHREVDESIKVILFTDPGERIMRPDYGSGVQGPLYAR